MFVQIKKMKKTIIFFVTWIGMIFSYLYPLTMSRYVIHFENLVYTAWLARFLKKIGKNSIICKKATVLGSKYIVIGNGVSIGKNAVLTAWDTYGNQTFCPNINIGDSCNIGEYCHISAINKIIFGQNVLTGRWLTVVDNGHGKTDIGAINIQPIKRPLFSKGPVVVEDNVWIGDKVTIMSGVTIGKNSIIGANTVITKNIPENSVVAGNPAKLLKYIR